MKFRELTKFRKIMISVTLLIQIIIIILSLFICPEITWVFILFTFILLWRQTWYIKLDKLKKSLESQGNAIKEEKQ